MLNKNSETFIACDAPYADAKIAMFGAGSDSTTSFRPGARFAPKYMRAESYGMETFSPYQNRDMADCLIIDTGDLDLPFGDSESALKLIQERAEKILSDGKLPFMMGGEHLVSLGAVRACAKKYPDLRIVHFDAHADLRSDYLGVKLSHACVMRRCHEIIGDGRIFQFGIRSGDRAEFEWGAKHVCTTRFGFSGIENIAEKIGRAPVYFSIDLDVLDPSVFPGTGTPEAGGVSFEQLREACACVCNSLNVVACDVVELAPHYDQSGISIAAAVKITRELLLNLHK